jgi:hypothetical protein
MHPYPIVGGGGLPTIPHPLNTSSHSKAARRPASPASIMRVEPPRILIKDRREINVTGFFRTVRLGR